MDTKELIGKLRGISNMRSTSSYKRAICKMAAQRLERLAAYEDSGLAPEDIKRVFNEDAVLKLAGQCLNTTPDHLRELVQAEKDGRLTGVELHRVVEEKNEFPVKKYVCKGCGEKFTDEDLREFREMGEAFHREKGCFLCPDCWDDFQQLTLEEQATRLLK